MRKCPICNSCLKRVWINYNLYFYCDFCKKYFDTNGYEAYPVEGE